MRRIFTGLLLSLAVVACTATTDEKPNVTASPAACEGPRWPEYMTRVLATLPAGSRMYRPTKKEQDSFVAAFNELPPKSDIAPAGMRIFLVPNEPTVLVALIDENDCLLMAQPVPAKAVSRMMGNGGPRV